jgi:GTPase SAR1 family protein
MTQSVTLVLFGGSGTGKSAAANAILQGEHFPESMDPYNPASRLKLGESLIGDTHRYVIDTPGITDDYHKDAANLETLTRFLRGYPNGINAFAIVANGQECRVTPLLRHIIRVLSQLSDDSTFWDHVCVIFTRCLAPSQLEMDKKQGEFRNEILKLIAESQGRESTTVPLPIFLVDSKQWRNNPNVNEVFERIVQFASESPALAMNHVKTPCPAPWKAVKETQTGVLVNTRIEGDRRIQTYHDREREKRILFDSNLESYSEWKVVKSWDEIKTSKTTKESKDVCELKEVRHKYHIEVGPRPLLGGLLGNPEITEVEDGDDVVETRAVMEREIFTDFDGKVSYGDWKTLRTYKK